MNNTTPEEMPPPLSLYHSLAQQFRADSIRSTTQAGSGHPTTCLSAADLMAVLLAGHWRYDFAHPKHPNNDRLIFSKGHAAPLLYALYKGAGAISDAELMTLRQFGSPFEGHPTPVLPWVDVATGSLGQGLGIGVGMALQGKYLDHLPFRVWVLLGDSEMAEGSVWEAFSHAGFHQLDNLIAILDMNRLGQRGPTREQWNGEAYAARAQAFGWHTILLDGHDLEAIDAAYLEAQESNQPSLLIAQTRKGRGVSLVEDQENWHGKALPPDEAEAALKELGNPPGNLVVKPQTPENLLPTLPPAMPLEFPSYPKGQKVATREAYGDMLKALGAARPEVVVLDAEVSNSTYSERFGQAFPDRFFEMYIAEQQMIGAAVGMAVLGKIPYASTFAAFLTRAFDQIRMAAISRANLCLCGSHAGVSIGQDGLSQMGLEDLAMMRAVPGSTVLYPSDATSTLHLTAAMADTPGITYLRTTREKTPVLYGSEESFPIGKSKVLRRSDRDVAAVIAAGITLHESLQAYETLQAEGLPVRVIDAYSVKPVDRETFYQAAHECGGLLIVVEDHWPEGGLGDAVMEAFGSLDSPPLPRVLRLGVQGLPGSGPPKELLEAAGISASKIVSTVRSAMSERSL